MAAEVSSSELAWLSVHAHEAVVTGIIVYVLRQIALGDIRQGIPGLRWVTTQFLVQGLLAIKGQEYRHQAGQHRQDQRESDRETDLAVDIGMFLRRAFARFIALL